MWTWGKDASVLSAVVVLAMTAGIYNAAAQPTPLADPIPQTVVNGDTVVELELVLDGMPAPIGARWPSDGTGRFFVYDQTGLVFEVDAQGARSIYLDVSSRLIAANEHQGLLGFDLHPNFVTNGKVYTFTSEPAGGWAIFTVPLNGAAPSHQSVLAEWTRQADGTFARREIFRIDQPQANNNGGDIQFGPDGMLYIAVGDGGGNDDVGIGHGAVGNGQNHWNALGVVLRIDVDPDFGQPLGPNLQYGIPLDNPFFNYGIGFNELYAYGFHDPHRFSFDTTSGDLWLADRGQNDIEEVDVVVGRGNYGWNMKEGTFYFVPGVNSPDGTGYVTNEAPATLPPDLVDPVAEYDHDDGVGVVGGYVYHGSVLPNLAGQYVFGDRGTTDSGSGRLFVLDAAGIWQLKIGNEGRPYGRYLKGFAQDPSGELYVFGSAAIGVEGNTGVMEKMVNAPPPPADEGGDIGTDGGSDDEAETQSDGKEKKPKKEKNNKGKSEFRGKKDWEALAELTDKRDGPGFSKNSKR